MNPLGPVWRQLLRIRSRQISSRDSAQHSLCIPHREEPWSWWELLWMKVNWEVRMGSRRAVAYMRSGARVAWILIEGGEWSP